MATNRRVAGGERENGSVPRGAVLAAGGVLWRGSGSDIEVAVIHRPRYDDWSLPKGKLAKGEHVLAAALREVEEETGVQAVLGRPLGRQRYPVASPGGPVTKIVDYWAMAATEGEFVPNDEVDQIRWLSVPAAAELLSRDLDRQVLARLLEGPRVTTAFVLLRHAAAGERSRWKKDDRLRPLDDTGRDQAARLVEILAGYAVTRVVSANMERCLQTVTPYADARDLAVEVEPLLSAPGHRGHVRATVKRLREMVASGEPTVACSQREVIPGLVKRLCAEFHHTPPRERSVPKGGFWVMHAAGGTMVDLERHTAA